LARANESIRFKVFAREVKRAKLVARYAEKRAALKKVIATTEDPSEAYEAARKLQAIPKNANPIRLHNRCKITGYKIDIKSESQAAEEAAKVSEEPEADEFEIEEDLFHFEVSSPEFTTSPFVLHNHTNNDSSTHFCKCNYYFFKINFA
jgi:hypothetical protein